MDLSKLNHDEIDLIRKISSRLDSTSCFSNYVKPKSRKGTTILRGKYKFPVNKLNNMHLSYEKLLLEAELCPKRLNKKFSVTDLKDDTQIGVFARQTLAYEMKRYL